MKPSQRRPVFASIPGRPGMKQFIGYEGDPGTVPQSRTTRPRAPGMNGYRGLGGPQDNRIPVMNLAGLGGSNASDRGSQGFPGTNGADPVFLSPYDETQMWGTNDPMGMVGAPIDPSVAMPPDQGPQVFDPGISIPFGVSIIPWRNPSTFQSVPILAATPINVPVLSLNMARNSLIVQNNSTATAPDIAPTFYIGFNAQPQVGLALALTPGAGILFDIITPRDAVYVLVAGGVGASVVVAGVVVQGTYAPI